MSEIDEFRYNKNMRQFSLKSVHMTNRLLIFNIILFSTSGIFAQIQKPQFNVIAFYNGNIEEAHASFIREANKWFRRTHSGLPPISATSFFER